MQLAAGGLRAQGDGCLVCQAGHHQPSRRRPPMRGCVVSSSESWFWSSSSSSSSCLAGTAPPGLVPPRASSLLTSRRDRVNGYPRTLGRPATLCSACACSSNSRAMQSRAAARTSDDIALPAASQRSPRAPHGSRLMFSPTPNRVANPG